MKNKKVNKNKISFGLQFASQEIVSKYADLTRDIIVNIIQIDPRDIILTDESDLFNFGTDEELISRTKKYYNISITEEQILKLRMKNYIELILSKRK